MLKEFPDECYYHSPHIAQVTSETSFEDISEAILGFKGLTVAASDTEPPTSSTSSSSSSSSTTMEAPKKAIDLDLSLKVFLAVIRVLTQAKFSDLFQLGHLLGLAQVLPPFLIPPKTDEVKKISHVPEPRFRECVPVNFPGGYRLDLEETIASFLVNPVPRNMFVFTRSDAADVPYSMTLYICRYLESFVRRIKVTYRSGDCFTGHTAQHYLYLDHHRISEETTELNKIAKQTSASGLSLEQIKVILDPAYRILKRVTDPTVRGQSDDPFIKNGYLTIARGLPYFYTVPKPIPVSRPTMTTQQIQYYRSLTQSNASSSHKLAQGLGASSFNYANYAQFMGHTNGGSNSNSYGQSSSSNINGGVVEIVDDGEEAAGVNKEDSFREGEPGKY